MGAIKEFFSLLESTGPLGIGFAIIVALFALKEIITLIKWIIDWVRGLFKPKEMLNQRLLDDEKEINSIKISQERGEKELKKIRDSLEILIESDKDDIKTFIVDSYYKFKKLQVIDCYSLDCLERRYKNYLKEGGNTYIETLMEELRALPKVTPINNPLDRE